MWIRMRLLTGTLRNAFAQNAGRNTRAKHEVFARSRACSSVWARHCAAAAGCIIWRRPNRGMRCHGFVRSDGVTKHLLTALRLNAG
ncbi:hypothetical protein KCP71_21570 [Salmonella enterica subsp. enterica]|nr:hypothetical protein KCP71_21570 [Salmonella enterica subsp. enterica]